MNTATEEITITIPPRPTRSHFGDVKLKPYTFWLPDTDNPEVREQLRKSTATSAVVLKHNKEERYLALHDDPEEQEWDRWCEAAFAETMKDEPPYDWGDDKP